MQLLTKVYQSKLSTLALMWDLPNHTRAGSTVGWVFVEFRRGRFGVVGYLVSDVVGFGATELTPPKKPESAPCLLSSIRKRLECRSLAIDSFRKLQRF